MFSIIVPSYNRPDEIPKLLASLKTQTVQNFEVIIVDDHSIVPVEIQDSYAFSCKIVRNNQNLGAAESRNIGARQASYDWLLFLDDDDMMVNEGFSYVTHPYRDTTQLTLDNILLANKIGGMPMIAIKKSLFLQVGGLSGYLRSLEDYEFLLKLLCESQFNPCYVDQALTICTFHTQRSSVSTNTKHTEQAIHEIKARYVKTEKQARHFELNALYMLAYPYVMNLSRVAAKYYFAIFTKTGSIKHLFMAGLTFISPSLAINMKRFM